MVNIDTSAVWQSRYSYSSHGELHTSGHRMVFNREGSKLVGKSLPNKTDSEATLILTEEDGAFTGTWRERTSPGGAFKGRIFHGALQLIFDDKAQRLHGKWVGFNSDRTEVKTGEWTLQKTATP